MIKIRKHTEDDLPFILNSFLKNLRITGFNKFMTTTYFFKMYRDPINEMVADSEILIACDEKENKFIQGFLIHKNGTVVYAYTRTSMRGLGVFKALFKELFGEWKITHNTYFINNAYRNIFHRKVRYCPQG